MEFEKIEIQKAESFKKDISNIKTFTKKLNDLYNAEFNEAFKQILTISKEDFMTFISNGVQISLSELYGEDIFENEKLINIQNKNLNLIERNYQNHYIKLDKAWKNFEKIKNKNNNNYYLTNFRKHCCNTDDIAFHNCQIESNSKYISVEENKIIKYVICSECKFVYFSNFILCYCSHCHIDYYSSILSKDENPNLLIATWGKYHCHKLINEKMKCIKCKNNFYLNLQTQMLMCLNKKCNFITKPSRLLWTCTICKEEFKSDAIVYNPLQYEYLKQVVNQTLLIRHKAHPSNMPCCDLNIFFTEYFHKKDCNGILYFGELNHNIIIVCDKCKAINFYERFIWTCPKCGMRFRDNNISKKKSFNQIFQSSSFHSIKFIQSERSSIESSRRSVNIETDKSSKDSNVKKKKKKRSKTNLFDILEKRRKNSESKNDIKVNNNYFDKNIRKNNGEDKFIESCQRMLDDNNVSYDRNRIFYKQFDKSKGKNLLDVWRKRNDKSENIKPIKIEGKIEESNIDKSKKDKKDIFNFNIINNSNINKDSRYKKTINIIKDIDTNGNNKEEKKINNERAPSRREERLRILREEKEKKEKEEKEKREKEEKERKEKEEKKRRERKEKEEKERKEKEKKDKEDKNKKDVIDKKEKEENEIQGRRERKEKRERERKEEEEKEKKERKEKDEKEKEEKEKNNKLSEGKKELSNLERYNQIIARRQKESEEREKRKREEKEKKEKEKEEQLKKEKEIELKIEEVEKEKSNKKDLKKEEIKEEEIKENKLKNDLKEEINEEKNNDNKLEKDNITKNNNENQIEKQLDDNKKEKEEKNDDENIEKKNENKIEKDNKEIINNKNKEEENKEIKEEKIEKDKEDLQKESNENNEIINEQEKNKEEETKEKESIKVEENKKEENEQKENENKKEDDKNENIEIKKEETEKEENKKDEIKKEEINKDEIKKEEEEESKTEEKKIEKTESKKEETEKEDEKENKISSSQNKQNKKIIDNFLSDDKTPKEKLLPIKEENEEETKINQKDKKEKQSKESKKTKDSQNIKTENTSENINSNSKESKENLSFESNQNKSQKNSLKTKGKEIKEEDKEKIKEKEKEKENENEEFGKEHEEQMNNIKKRIDKIISSAKLPQFKVEDYIIKGQLGEGSYGAIYKVSDKYDKKYAMKKIIAHDIDEVEDFIKEFELVSTCNHPHIMKIYSMCVRILDPTTYAVYILMEIAICDWDQEIKKHLQQRKNYKEEELISIMKQLISALVYMQKEMKIAHRDIKPQNILVFNNGLYKVADFGEAKEVKISKQLNTLRGTELYMSPLLYDGLKKDKDDVTHNPYKSDVFSLGFCFMYSSSLNFNIIYEVRDLNDMSKLDKILHKHLKNKYTEKFINVIQKMLEVDESKRIDFLELNDYIYEVFPDEGEEYVIKDKEREKSEEDKDKDKEKIDEGEIKEDNFEKGNSKSNEKNVEKLNEKNIENDKEVNDKDKNEEKEIVKEEVKDKEEDKKEDKEIVKEEVKEEDKDKDKDKENDKEEIKEEKKEFKEKIEEEEKEKEKNIKEEDNKKIEVEEKDNKKNEVKENEEKKTDEESQKEENENEKKEVKNKENNKENE